MVLFDALRDHADAIRQVGERAAEEARRLGVPCHYMDATISAGIIRELPDGSRQRVELRDGREVVVGTFSRCHSGRRLLISNPLGIVRLSPKTLTY